MFTVSCRYHTRGNGYEIVEVWRMLETTFDSLESAKDYASRLCSSYAYRVHDGETVYRLEWVDESPDSDYCVPVLVLEKVGV